MRVLVCGGAGYIGSNMTALLAAEGYEPVVFDNLCKGHISAIPQPITSCSQQHLATRISKPSCTSRRSSRWANRLPSP
ncbi:MAG: NAD-dependent epimerase/dehydratase family protein [Planctomycetota bacterium]